jgi:hypothetical protein
MDENIFAEAILEAFHLAFLVMAICFWIAISELLLELLDCKNKHKN